MRVAQDRLSLPDLDTFEELRHKIIQELSILSILGYSATPSEKTETLTKQLDKLTTDGVLRGWLPPDAHAWEN